MQKILAADDTQAAFQLSKRLCYQPLSVPCVPGAGFLFDEGPNVLNLISSAAAALRFHPHLASKAVHTSVAHPTTAVNTVVLLIFGLRHLKGDY